ncbi:MAG: hypothetical protein L3J74_08680 [Bacteroidales bacterium]|nr:hypothetical protein [Bacteroidales bacterium]
MEILCAFDKLIENKDNFRTTDPTEIIKTFERPTDFKTLKKSKKRILESRNLRKSY